jgi:hypothetical protein
MFCTLSLRIWGLRKCGAGEESIPENCAGYDYLIKFTAAWTEPDQIRMSMNELFNRIDISKDYISVLKRVICKIIKHAQFRGLAIQEDWNSGRLYVADQISMI